MVYTKNDLFEGIEVLGIRSNDTVYIRSSRKPLEKWRMLPCMYRKAMIITCKVDFLVFNEFNQ